MIQNVREYYSLWQFAQWPVALRDLCHYHVFGLWHPSLVRPLSAEESNFYGIETHQMCVSFFFEWLSVLVLCTRLSSGSISTEQLALPTVNAAVSFT